MKIALKYQFQILISAIKYQFLKVTRKCNLTWKLETSVFTDPKNPVQLLPKLVNNLFQWMIFFNFTNISTCIYYVLMTRKRQQSSGKFMIWKIFIVKWRSFQFSTKFEKSLSCLHLKETSPICSKTLVVQN